MPSEGKPGRSRGYVIPVGGAEEKINSPVILERFAELAGCEQGNITIIPTASCLDETGPQYAEIFDALGIPKINILPITSRSDCFREDYLETLGHSTGIFITGGNQLRLSTIMGGTPIARRIRHLNADGVHVAGTSAGAAFVPEHMITGGSSGSTPREDGVRLAPGLGLTNSLMVDQHFRQRDRLGRLLSALAYNPFITGIGIDEDTAAFIGPEDEFEVVGSGAITVIDPSELSFSSMSMVSSGEPVTLIGLRVHILANGGRYNTLTREASAS